MKNYKEKICIICGKEFMPANNRQKYCVECRVIVKKEQDKQGYKDNIEEKKKQSKQYDKDHKEKRKEQHKQWRRNNAEQIKEYSKQWRKDNAKQKKERDKQYRKDHKEEAKEYKKQYRQTPNGITSHRKGESKRNRNLGYKPINEPFEGCEGHHYDNDRVIYIPTELHQSVWHNLETGQGMKEINMLAIDYLWIEMWNTIGETEPKLLEGG